MDINVNQILELGYTELLSLQEKLEFAIKQKRKEGKEQLKQKILTIAHEDGFKLSDLFPEFLTDSTRKERKERKPVEHTFVNPNNENERYSGRGRKPSWFNELVESGIDLETIKQSVAA